MLMPAEDQVSLLIGGKEHSDWETYEIDSDLLIPADAWQVALGVSAASVPDNVAVGNAVVVKIGQDTVLTGHVDEIAEPVNKSGHTFSMSGRDLAADLLDCACPIFSLQEATLKQIATTICAEFKLGKPNIGAVATRIRKKVTVDPGVSAWDALVHAAEANGLWPWFEPDGTLMVGGPDYSLPIVATLILRRDGQGNNVLSLDPQKSMAERYSKVTVYSQAPGSNSGDTFMAANNAVHATVTEDELFSNSPNNVKRHRPHIVIDNECDTPAACKSRATKILTDSRLKGFTLMAEVVGHRIDAPGQPSHGQLWKPMQRIRVISEPHGLDGIYFLMARKLKRSRSTGTTTTLTLKEDRMWVTEAHPHSKHARGKNSLMGMFK